MNMKQYKAAADKVTLEQAQEWLAETDKFVYCVDYLEISAHDANSDGLVRMLETRFERMLKNANLLLCKDCGNIVDKVDVLCHKCEELHGEILARDLAEDLL